ncbi:MAG TPA: hypothetical protein VMT83_04485 [Burkholderiaceae bacterium]|nr:hypothetical protein [Burkholderiaceae bacterium]
MREQRLVAARRWVVEQWPRWLPWMLAVAALWPLGGRGHADRARAPAAHEWPATWRGGPLRPLASTPVELRFGQHFPGHIGRFAAADGSVWVLRDIAQPTRTLHPAGDCFRGLGYRIEHAQLQREADASLWRCFVAERDGESVRVCERIVDAHAQGFVDASSWYWAAVLGRSRGPWRAMTHVESL